MGIYIKGMEMPKSRGEYVLLLYVDSDGTATVEGAHSRIEGEPFEAVPIPPHGRLIDADALGDVFRGFIAMYDSCPFSQLSLPDKARRDELQSALAEVINAPTIIEAEEGE